jgi:hypothetical protein
MGIMNLIIANGPHERNRRTTNALDALDIKEESIIKG